MPVPTDVWIQCFDRFLVCSMALPAVIATTNQPGRMVSNEAPPGDVLPVTPPMSMAEAQHELDDAEVRIARARALRGLFNAEKEDLLMERARVDKEQARATIEGTTAVKKARMSVLQAAVDDASTQASSKHVSRM